MSQQIQFASSRLSFFHLCRLNSQDLYNGVKCSRPTWSQVQVQRKGDRTFLTTILTQLTVLALFLIRSHAHLRVNHCSQGDVNLCPTLCHMSTPEAGGQISRGRVVVTQYKSKSLLLENKDVGTGYKLLIYTLNLSNLSFCIRILESYISQNMTMNIY